MREFPASDRIAGRFADGKLAFLTITKDRDPDEITKVIKQLGTPLPVLLDDGSTWAAYRVQSLPTFYLIDQEQRVFKIWIGPVEDRETEITESVKSLLKPDAPSVPE